MTFGSFRVKTAIFRNFLTGWFEHVPRSQTRRKKLFYLILVIIEPFYSQNSDFAKKSLFRFYAYAHIKFQKILQTRASTFYWLSTDVSIT